MQHRLFIHCALLILAFGCFALGLITTLISLAIFSVAVECVNWSRVFENNGTEQPSEII